MSWVYFSWITRSFVSKSSDENYKCMDATRNSEWKHELPQRQMKTLSKYKMFIPHIIIAAFKKNRKTNRNFDSPYSTIRPAFSKNKKKSWSKWKLYLQSETNRILRMRKHSLRANICIHRMHKHSFIEVFMHSVKANIRHYPFSFCDGCICSARIQNMILLRANILIPRMHK